MLRRTSLGLLAGALGRVQETALFRATVEEVEVVFTARDGGRRLVKDLRREEVRVWEDGASQRITRFAREEETPLRLLLVLDVSGSVKPLLEQETGAAAAFVEQVMRPGDSVGVAVFAVSTLIVRKLTANKEQAMAALRRIPETRWDWKRTKGFDRTGARSSVVWEAVYLAGRELREAGTGRKAVVLFSDGLDAGSAVSREQAVRMVNRSGMVLYSVYGAALRGPGEGYEGMRELAEQTGGRIYEPRTEKESERAFTEMAEELRSQYSLAYQPSNGVRDGKYRKIRVAVGRQGVRVRARRGYFAPSDGEEAGRAWK